MHKRDLFQNISPIDHRYYLANKDVFDKLSEYLSEDAVVKYCIKAESALLKSYISLYYSEYSKHLRIIDSLTENISTEEVYIEEEKTKHNIRALVNIIKNKVPEEIRPFVHLGATSVDILDTASALRYRDAVRKVILPLALDIEKKLIEIAEKNAETPQIGRTHGQHAVPITLGFAFAEYVSRFGKSILKIEELSLQLKGKLAGATGSYNSISLIVKNPLELEKKYLDYLNIEPSEHSTQIVEPEYLLRLLLEINIAFGILANLADDLRNLQRSEISEIREKFAEGQVGSSTMPHKRNPWNSEHVKSLWKTFSPRVISFFMDQISEHQRDLTNSASSRFIADYLAGFTSALNRTNKILSTIYVDDNNLQKNITITGDMVLSEAAYILLSVSGVSDAHEYIRKITVECDKYGTKLIDQLKMDNILWNKISMQLEKTTGISPEEFFSNPELYRGKAVEKTKSITMKYASEIKRLQEILD